MVVWLIGLAGAGKTSIGRALYKLVRDRDPATVFIDGDHVRNIMGHDLGYSLEDRRANGWRICRLCAYLDQQNINVVCATLSQFHDQQQWNRAEYSRYFEVFVDVPMETLVRRDQKGLYTGALAGTVKNVVGVDMPFPAPLAPDLVLANGEPVDDFGLLAGRIFAELSERYPSWEQKQ
jgi:adenylylsulfate kinase-like enzyme